MARIENHKYSIEEAFRECFYIVPDYQREYVWTDKEVHQLLEDIGEQIDVGTTREYFIGTVLVEPVINFVCKAYHVQQEHVCQAKRS